MNFDKIELQPDTIKKFKDASLGFDSSNTRQMAVHRLSSLTEPMPDNFGFVSSNSLDATQIGRINLTLNTALKEIGQQIRVKPAYAVAPLVGLMEGRIMVVPVPHYYNVHQSDPETIASVDLMRHTIEQALTEIEL